MSTYQSTYQYTYQSTFLFDFYAHYVPILHRLVTIHNAANTLIDGAMCSYRKWRGGNNTETELVVLLVINSTIYQSTWRTGVAGAMDICIWWDGRPPTSVMYNVQPWWRRLTHPHSLMVSFHDIRRLSMRRCPVTKYCILIFGNISPRQTRPNHVRY